MFTGLLRATEGGLSAVLFSDSQWAPFHSRCCFCRLATVLHYSFPPSTAPPRPLTHMRAHSSVMFFLVRTLQACKNMYQFSLASFLRLFTATLREPLATGPIAGGGGSAAVEERIRRLTPGMRLGAAHFVDAERCPPPSHYCAGSHEFFWPQRWRKLCCHSSAEACSRRTG
jgi:hypothetical protein